MKQEKRKQMLKEIEDYSLISEALSNSDFKFKEGFSDRLMQKLDKQNIDLFSRFKRIGYTAAAAVAILVVSVYFTDGSLSLDAFYGLQNYSAEQEFYSLLNI